MAERNIVEELKQKCAMAGVKLSEVCRRAKVNRSILERWKTSNPRSIEIYLSLEQAIEEIKNEK